LVGVAGDAEEPLVVHAVVVAAEADEVPGDGVAVVFPVDDVVDLDVGLAVAAGDAAAAVAVFDEAADAAGDDAVGAADLDGVAFGVPHGGDVAVAGEVPAQGVGEGGAHVHLGPPRVSVDGGLEVDQHAGAGGDLGPGGVVAEDALGHPDDGIGP
jgi:hypothetical protein